MNKVEELEKELLHLEAVIRQCMKDIKEAPKGAIHLQRRNKAKSFSWVYHYQGKTTYFSVAKQENVEVLKKLLQKAYARKVLNVAMGQKVIIERFLSSYNPKAIAEVYEHMAKEKKQYVEPFRTLEQEEEHIDEEELRIMKEMRSLCDAFLKRKAT